MRGTACNHKETAINHWSTAVNQRQTCILNHLYICLHKFLLRVNKNFHSETAVESDRGARPQAGMGRRERRGSTELRYVLTGELGEYQMGETPVAQRFIAVTTEKGGGHPLPLDRDPYLHLPPSSNWLQRSLREGNFNLQSAELFSVLPSLWPHRYE